MILPPGRLRLVTRPSLHRVSADRLKTIGMVVVAALAASAEGCHRDRSRPLGGDEVGRQRRQSIVLALRPTIFDRHVLSLDIAGFVETLPEGRSIAAYRLRAIATEKADHRHRRLLRARRERPRRR